MRPIAFVMLLTGLLNAPRSVAQLRATAPEFEVASIRENVDGGQYVFNGMKSLGMFSSQNQTLKNLIQEAYGVPSGRRNWLPVFTAAGQGLPIYGGPDWVGSVRYDITARWNARPDDGRVTLQTVEKAQHEMELMLRSLLEQRFRLKVHREVRDLPVYEMTLVNPYKLRQGACTVFEPDDPRTATNQPSETAPQAVHYCGTSSEGRRGLDWVFDGTGIRMPQLADTLSFLIGGRTVIDKTGYTGTFDAHLRWTPEPGEVGATNVPGSPDDVAESIFTVTQERLGLKLKAGRGPVEVLVIDRVEKPSAN